MVLQTPEQSAPSRSVDLEPNLTGTETLRRIGRSCIDLLEHNEPLVISGDADGVHQMRVSIRRLRAALSGFSDAFDDDFYEWIDGELKSLAHVLGNARDLDVFQDSLMHKAKDSVPETMALVPPMVRLRNAAHEVVRRAIQSPRYGALKTGLGLLFDGRISDNTEVIGQKLRDIAPQILDTRYNTAFKQATRKNYTDLSEKRRHRLRLALKKLRYTCELYGVLYERSSAEHFASQLKRLQDHLGDANDVLVGRKIVKKQLDAEEAGRKMIGWHERRIARDEPRLLRHLRDFLEIKPFWR